MKFCELVLVGGGCVEELALEGNLMLILGITLMCQCILITLVQKLNSVKAGC